MNEITFSRVVGKRRSSLKTGMTIDRNMEFNQSIRAEDLCGYQNIDYEPSQDHNIYQHYDPQDQPLP